jgi:ribonuclease HI
VVVHSDSEYSVKALTEWFPRWSKLGWTTSTGGAVANRGLLEEIMRVVGKHRAAGGEVAFRHVRGHVGLPENERADHLAGVARKDGVSNLNYAIPRHAG